MTCYEICTGRIPLQKKVQINDYNFVLEEWRPALPNYIDSEVRKLIQRCWHQDPSDRPTFSRIVEELDRIRNQFPNLLRNIHDNFY